jgi:hypothetical protein
LFTAVWRRVRLALDPLPIKRVAIARSSRSIAISELDGSYSVEPRLESWIGARVV